MWPFQSRFGVSRNSDCAMRYGKVATVLISREYVNGHDGIETNGINLPFESLMPRGKQLYLPVFPVLLSPSCKKG